MNLNWLSPLYMLHLGDIIHHFACKKFIRSQIQNKKLIYDAVKILHERILKVALGVTLTSVKKLQVFLKGLQEHASKLEATIFKDVEKKLKEKRLEELVNRYAVAHI